MSSVSTIKSILKGKKVTFFFEMVTYSQKPLKKKTKTAFKRFRSFYIIYSALSVKS